MKRCLLALTLVCAMMFVTANSAFALQKKTFNKEEFLKRQQQNATTQKAPRPEDLLTMEAQPKSKTATKAKPTTNAKPTTQTPPAKQDDKDILIAVPKTRTLKDRLKDLRESKAVKAAEQKIKTEAEAKAREAAIELVEVGAQKLPKELYDLYSGATLGNATQEYTDQINKLITDGPKLTNTDVEGKIRDAFGTATQDTGAFASGVLKKYSMQSLVNIAIQNPKNVEGLKKAVQDEMENYAKQEANKIANQLIQTLIPQLQGINLDFTDMNKNNIKASMRSIVINALTQSYLGPGYAALYVAFEMLFPKEAAKVHAELRRFDKRYLQPITGGVQDAIGSAVDKTAAELKRTGKRVGKELEREAKDVINAPKKAVQEVKRAEKKVNNEVKRATKKLKKKLKF